MSDELASELEQSAELLLEQLEQFDETPGEDATERPDAEEQSADFRKGADEPLRNTSDWAMFDVQPHEIEALHDEIADDVAELYDQILSDDEVERLIEQFAETDGSDTTEKSLTGLSRRIQELLSDSDVADRIREAVDDARTSQIREAIEHAARQEDDDIDTDPIMDAVADREVPFADRMVDRVSEQVREKVADGWQEGKNSLEIRDDIATSPTPTKAGAPSESPAKSCRWPLGRRATPTPPRPTASKCGGPAATGAFVSHTPRWTANGNVRARNSASTIRALIGASKPRKSPATQNRASAVGALPSWSTSLRSTTPTTLAYRYWLHTCLLTLCTA